MGAEVKNISIYAVYRVAGSPWALEIFELP